MKDHFNVIIFFKDRAPIKYRNVSNPEGMKKYLNRKKLTPWYINYYNAITKAYLHREYLQ